MYIVTNHSNETIRFAGEELEKYLRKMGNTVDSHGSGITLGLYSDFADCQEETSQETDSFLIAVENGEGRIAGSNGRSVLYGVYTYLKKLGCRWVRPGADGEYVPQCNARAMSVHCSETASYRFRGLEAGGAVSLENVLEQIDWSAKMGFNRIFVELVDPAVHFQNWYEHRNNPKKTPEPISQEQIDAYFQQAAQEILKRGMVFQKAGHGFMCEPFGINVKNWGETTQVHLEPEILEMMPEINGVRGLHKNIPMITNFCLSNQKARKRVVEYTTAYAKAHPEAEEIHFWLADGFDNHCECEQCRQALPSDYYVMLLNELDEAWTAAGIPAKIALLSYVELMWAPVREKLKNKDRFIMMFCPITRSNAVSYKMEDPYAREVITPEFVRNNFNWPMSAAENFAFLKQWQQTQPNISAYLEFGYHFTWREYSDYSFYNTSRNICEDVQYLKKAGMDGMVMCQHTRSYFPTGLGLYTLARSLWDSSLDFQDIAAEYLQDAFGEGWEFVRKYLSTLSEVSEYEADRYPYDVPPKYVAMKRQWVREFVEQTDAARKEHVGANAMQAASWKYLNLHADFLPSYAKLLDTLDRKDGPAAALALAEAADLVQAMEDQIQPVFDVYWFVRKYQTIVDALNK